MQIDMLMDTRQQYGEKLLTAVGTKIAKEFPTAEGNPFLLAGKNSKNRILN